MVAWRSHHCEAVLGQKQTQSEGRVRRRVSTGFTGKPEKVRGRVTLSSPAATLKASSMTEPTAMRTAADECISFQTVSLSTCGGGVGGSTDIKISHADTQRLDGQILDSPLCRHREERHTSSG